MDVKTVLLIVTFVACASSHRHGGHGGHGNREFGRFEFPKMTDTEIKNSITTMVTQENKNELVVFLTAMNTPEGQLVLSRFGVPPAAIQGVLTQMQSNDPTVVAQAKASLQPMLSGLNYTSHADLDSIYNVHQLYKVRLMAIQFVQGATYPELSGVLNTLTTNATLPVVRSRHRGFYATATPTPFDFGINFADLSSTLKVKGEAGLQEVKDKIVAWIRIATPTQLQKAGEQYRKAILVFPATTPLVPVVTVVPTTTTSPNPTTPVVRIPAQP